jgi:hypothetical protein
MAMVLVLDIAKGVDWMLLAVIAIELVSDIENEPDVYLVAATDMVDVSLMATAAFETTEAPMLMELVAVIVTLGSNEPFE